MVLNHGCEGTRVRSMSMTTFNIMKSRKCSLREEASHKGMGVARALLESFYVVNLERLDGLRIQ